MAQENKAQSEIRYLNPVSVDVKKKKYCRFKKLGIKYVDYTQNLFFEVEVLEVAPCRQKGRQVKAVFD